MYYQTTKPALFPVKMAYSTPEIGLSSFFFFFFLSLMCLRYCYAPFRVKVIFRMENSNLHSSVHSKLPTDYPLLTSTNTHTTQPMIFFSLYLCEERKYFLVDQLIKLEKLTSFWTHNDLFQAWHRNMILQKYMQAKNSCSEFKKAS